MATSKRVTVESETQVIDEMQKITEKLEMSQFYHDFREDVQGGPISEHIQRVLGPETKMQMIFYGIGNILDEKDISPKLQLSLVILMKKDLPWIGEVQVFDPILSTLAIQILKYFGCTVLSVNENARRQALKPTMFFMPFCDINLYNNLLEANWEPDVLSNVIIFGNSLDSYIKDLAVYSSLCPSISKKRRFLSGTWEKMGHILAAQTFTNEFRMRTICYGKLDEFVTVYQSSFNDFTWHFFSPPTERRMWLMREKTMEEYGVSNNRQKEKLVEEGLLLKLPEKLNQKTQILAPNSSQKMAEAEPIANHGH